MEKEVEKYEEDKEDDKFDHKSSQDLTHVLCGRF